MPFAEARCHTRLFSRSFLSFRARATPTRRPAPLKFDIYFTSTYKRKRPHAALLLHEASFIDRRVATSFITFTSPRPPRDEAYEARHLPPPRCCARSTAEPACDDIDAALPPLSRITIVKLLLGLSRATRFFQSSRTTLPISATGAYQFQRIAIFPAILEFPSMRDTLWRRHGRRLMRAHAALARSCQ